MGERWAWYQVASHLKMPVGELKQRITFTEFLEWLEFLRRDEERNSKMDYYLSQIAAEVRRGWVKQAKSVKVSDFLIKLVPTQQEAKVQKSKQSWAFACGLKLKPN